MLNMVIKRFTELLSLVHVLRIGRYNVRWSVRLSSVALIELPKWTRITLITGDVSAKSRVGGYRWGAPTPNVTPHSRCVRQLRQTCVCLHFIEPIVYRSNSSSLHHLHLQSWWLWSVNKSATSCLPLTFVALKIFQTVYNKLVTRKLGN